MGTPDFALPSFKAVVESNQTLVCVITQPDRPKGRGHRLSPPPVKIAAETAGIPVLQPKKMKDPAFWGKLTQLNPDLIVVVAFGRILPPEVLKIPRRGCVNLHASLLPKYRGAAPSAWAIIRGEKQTGVTTIQMDEGMDTGEIYLQKTMEILPSDTAGTLTGRLSETGAELLLMTLEGIMNGTLKTIPQNHSKATLAPILKKEHGEINWTLSASKIANLVRGLDPWPGAYTYYLKERWKLCGVTVRDTSTDKRPGAILKVVKDHIEVATGEEVLAIHELQPANARRMSVKEFLAGHDIEEGIILGE